MYGTRDAANNWVHEYVTIPEQLGFTKGKASPCVFFHAGRNARLVVHGDDFTLLGKELELDWLRRQVSNRFEVNFRGRIGPSSSDGESIRILNRVVEWTGPGTSYEAEQRHAEMSVSTVGLDKGSKGVSAPGVKTEAEPQDEVELPPEDSTKYWAMVARANYFAQDRTDIAYPVKELCRSASNPTQGDWAALKRLARYLSNKTK